MMAAKKKVNTLFYTAFTVFLLIANMSMITVNAINLSASVAEKDSTYQDEKQEKSKTLFIVDGEEKSANEVDKLKLEEIKQMEYVQEKEKIKLYTDKEVEMVVLITTKNGEKEK